MPKKPLKSTKKALLQRTSTQKFKRNGNKIIVQRQPSNESSPPIEPPNDPLLKVNQGLQQKNHSYLSVHNSPTKHHKQMFPFSPKHPKSNGGNLDMLS